MYKYILPVVLTGLFSADVTLASEGQQQAESFANIYASTCIQHMTNLDELREKLQAAPQLPPEKTAHFLAGREGQAWPVPDRHGTYVLVLHNDKNFCAVHARRADTEAARELFVKLVAAPVAMARSQIEVKQVTDEQRQTDANGLVKTIAYEWSTPGAPRKMLFMLSTASSDTAQLQVLGSVSITRE